MEVQIKPMDRPAAEEITRWRYPKPYNIYNFSPNPQTFRELLEGSFYSAWHGGQLIGFFCYGRNARIPHAEQLGLYPAGYTDIGLALHPDWTGKGHGPGFVRAGMEYGRELFGLPLRLTVAQFNQRAISVYARLGFKTSKGFLAPGGRGFIIMVEEKPL